MTAPGRPRSETTLFVPGSKGWTELPEVLAPASSIVSGANIWYRRGRIEPRLRLAQLGTNRPVSNSSTPISALLYDGLSGERFPIVTAAQEISYLDTDSWVSLEYVSGTSNLPPTGGEGDLWFGDVTYLQRRDLNTEVMTNGVDPIFVWGGSSDGTGFSTQTEAPICKDLVLFDDRVVSWNIRELSSSSRFITRVQWTIAGNPEDSTGIGSGFVDLLHMRGTGTRILSQADQMILASTQEIWRGRRIGGEFIFDFSVIRTNLGMPFPRPVFQTPFGIVWLNSDYMVYLLDGERITPLGEAIQRTLRDTAVSLDKAFFSYNDELQQLTLFYTKTVGSYPQDAFTIHLDEGVWTPHTYAHQLSAAFEANTPTSATTWDGLVGTLAAQNQTYNETLASGTPDEALLSLQQPDAATAGPTAYFYSNTTARDGSQVVNGQLYTGVLFPTDPQRMNFVDELRLDARTDSASSLSVSISGSGSEAFQDQQEFALSVRSTTTQQLLHLGVPGTDHTMRLQSEDTGWSVGRIFAKAQALGESL